MLHLRSHSATYAVALTTLVFAFTHGVCRAQGSTTSGFVDETNLAGLGLDSVGLPLGAHGRGAATADFDGDGDLDLVVPGLGPTPILYFENDGHARFTDESLRSGLTASGNAISAHAGDVDNDGDPDLIIGRTDADSLFINDGTGRFVDESFRIGNGSPGPTYSASFGDYDLDGDIDIALGVWSPVHRNMLLQNQGDGTFQDKAAGAGVAQRSMTFVNSWLDYNDDGLPDLYCANDKGAQLQPNSLFENQGDGLFIDVAPSLGADAAIFSMGLDHADVFNDGGTDIYVTDGPPDHLFLHWEGSAYVERQLDFAVEGGIGYTGWGCNFFDYDNDGWLDIYAVDEDQPNPLYRNPGTPPAQLVPWTNVSTQVGANASRPQTAVLVADWDSDGRMDILQIYRATVAGIPQRLELRMNRIPRSPQNHWIKIRTVGTVSNREGQGTQIALFAGGIRQRQQVRSSVGFAGGGDRRVHFGLGSSTAVDRLELRWPSGQVQVLENVPADRILTVVEPSMRLVGQPRIGRFCRLRMQCPGDDNSHYAILLASSDAPSTPLGDGRTIPIAIDGLTAATLMPGNGILHDNLEAMPRETGEATLTIPADASLVGMELHATGFTFTPGVATLGTVFPRAVDITITN